MNQTAIATIAADFELTVAEVEAILAGIEALHDEFGNAARPLTGDEVDVLAAYNELTIPADVRACR